MSDFETAARPYAKALFELATDGGNLQAWQDALELASAVASDADMQAMFEMPSMLVSEQADFFLSVMSSVKDAPELSADFKNLIALLAENGRLAALPAIKAGFETLKQEAEGKIEVLVRSARELSDKQQDDISKGLAKRLGKEVTIIAEIDETLIAGAVIQAGDLVIDGSARGRMEKLTTVLNK
ncbi:MAG: F0F1 ATP synthase subunit delta [Proteobacteria bacterium]|nr:F0F1 ATP synthase subunit delta [Pseudomonadota bacterium]